MDTGWTFYTPYSTVYSNGHVIAMATGIFITGFSSIFTGLNFIVTTQTMRAPGMHWFRLPLFVWSLYATSIILVLATPVLAILLLLIAVERLTGVGVFNPNMGGDPLLFQHLFWFYSHPAVYIMILPGLGVESELIACFARKRIFGYKYVAYCSVAIAILSFLVWGHHLFVASQSIYAGLIFSMLSFLVAISSAGASILAIGYALPLCYLTWSFFFGRPAPQNPWQASGLEWTHTSSPPIRTNFEEIPIVTKEDYDYPYPETAHDA